MRFILSLVSLSEIASSHEDDAYTQNKKRSLGLPTLLLPNLLRNVRFAEVVRLGKVVQLVELLRKDTLVELRIRTEVVAINYEVFAAFADHYIQTEQHQVEFRTKCPNELVHVSRVETRLFYLLRLLFVIRRTECDLTVKLKALCTVQLNQTFWD